MQQFYIRSCYIHSTTKIHYSVQTETITEKIRAMVLGGIAGESEDNPNGVLALDCINCDWRYIGKLQHEKYHFVTGLFPENWTLECKKEIFQQIMIAPFN